MALDQKCIIHGCTNMGRLRSEVCRTCSANRGYWERRIEEEGIQVVFDRQRALEKWQDRMVYLGNRDKEYINVARFFKRRRG